MVDGYGVGDVGNVVLRDRHHRSEDGIIIVTAAIDGSNGQVLSGPDLVSRGFVYVRESEELMEGARTQVEMALDRSPASVPYSLNSSGISFRTNFDHDARIGKRRVSTRSRHSVYHNACFGSSCRHKCNSPGHIQNEYTPRSFICSTRL